MHPHSLLGFSGRTVVKNLAASTRDPRFDLWVGKTPGVGNGNPFQYSCLENPMDRGAWRTTVHGAAEWDRTEHTHTHTPL